MSVFFCLKSTCINNWSLLKFFSTSLLEITSFQRYWRSPRSSRSHYSSLRSSREREGVVFIERNHVFPLPRQKRWNSVSTDRRTAKRSNRTNAKDTNIPSRWHRYDDIQREGKRSKQSSVEASIDDIVTAYPICNWCLFPFTHLVKNMFGGYCVFIYLFILVSDEVHPRDLGEICCFSFAVSTCLQ